MTATLAPAALDPALAVIAAGAPGRDRAPAFPADAFAALAPAGALAGGRAPSREWALVRAVARADGSVGRILDGHLNAVERVALLAPEPLRSAHLAEAAAGERLLGVWGADPAPGEGEPAGDPRRRAARRQDVLLGRRRPARRARASPATATRSGWPTST